MILQMIGVPDTMVGFRALGDITKEDYDAVVIPAVENFVKRNGRLNYLMVIDTPLSEFSMGAWWKDALLGLKNLTKWHKAAIVSNSDAIVKFTDVFSAIVPGEFKGFKPEEIDKAIAWTSS